MKPLLFIHIGYPKTASTWLQKVFFLKNPEINYIGIKYGKDANERSRHDSKIAKFLLGPKYMDLRGMPAYYSYITALPLLDEERFSILDFKRRLKKDIKKNVPNLISCEGYIRPFQTDEIFERVMMLNDSYDVRLIMSLRQQTDIIKSRYFHDVNLFNKKGYPIYSLETAIDSKNNVCYHPGCGRGLYECKCRETGVKSIDLQLYDYEKMYERCVKTVGVEKTHLFFFEGFKRNFKEELYRLQEFVVGKRSEDFIETLNFDRIGERNEDFKQKVMSIEGNQNFEEVLEKIALGFLESNKSLMNIYGYKQMEEYGYIE